jgi:hypothetical protein
MIIGHSFALSLTDSETPPRLWQGLDSNVGMWEG